MPPVTDEMLQMVASVLNNGGKVSDRKGMRLERSGKYWRYRWQRKDEHGKSIKYKTKTGNTGYKRGCEYIGKRRPA